MSSPALKNTVGQTLSRVVYVVKWTGQHAKEAKPNDWQMNDKIGVHCSARQQITEIFVMLHKIQYTRTWVQTATKIRLFYFSFRLCFPENYKLYYQSKEPRRLINITQPSMINRQTVKLGLKCQVI